MKIVGVGCGPGLLTEQAIQAISQADLIFGSDRAIELAGAWISPTCTVKTIDDFKQLDTLPDHAVVLSTGDPMLAGLGYLSGEVVPGISSFQLAAARLKIPIARMSVVVAHGTGHRKGIDETVREAGAGKIVFLLTDPKFNVDDLYSSLAALDRSLKVALCEHLGYPDERIIVQGIRSPPYPSDPLYSLVIGDF